MSGTFVVLMGLGTVFAGLICIILICKLMSFILADRKTAPQASAAPVAAPAAVVSDEIPNRPMLVAAVSAAIAEELGTDPSGIRILSIKKCR